MENDSLNDLTIQRYLYQSLIYTVYWRDNKIQSKDADNLCIEVRFPSHLKIPAYIDDFDYLPYSKRIIQFGITEQRLPPFVFRKDIEPFYPKNKSLLSKVLENHSANQNYKYGPNDLHLLLGSTNPVSLITLVESFGFNLQIPYHFSFR